MRTLVRPIGDCGYVIWDDKGELKKFRITVEEYDALGLKDAGAPPMAPDFTGTKDEWAALWETGINTMKAIRTNLYDTPSGDLEDGSVVLEAFEYNGSGVEKTPTPVPFDDVLQLAKVK